VIVDTSAIIAMLRNEPAGSRCADHLAEAEVVRISAATYLEASIVVDGSRNPALSQEFDDLIEAAEMLIEPVTEHHAHLAREAYRTFGRGSGHPARLNFGDCFAYALAKETNVPLLFVGNDFAHTDVRPAVDWRGSPP